MSLHSSIRRWSALAFALANSLVLTAQAHPPDAGRATFVAAVSGDGLLVPIAVYEGDTWWNRWPWGAESAEIRALPVPPTLRDVPADWLPPGITLPSEWRFQSRAGAQSTVHAIQPVRPTEADMDMITTIGLQSDLRVSKRDRLLASEGLGLAITGDGQLGRAVAPGQAEAGRILKRLGSRVQDLERAELVRWWRESRRSGTMNLALDKRRGEGSPGLTRAGTTADGAYYYYLESSRVYRVPGEECGVNLSTDGVVVARRDGSIVSERISADAYGEYCGDAAEWMDLLGTVTVHGHLYWVVKLSVEDGYDYDLYDPERSETIELKGRWELRSNGGFEPDA